MAATGTGLIRYEAACRALAKAKSVDEVKEVHAGAAAMRAYARQAKNRQLEIDASEIRFRAERRLGELIAAQRDRVGLAKGGRPYQATGSASAPVKRSATLAEAGIDKKLSSRAQKYAAFPEREFETILAERRKSIETDNARVNVDLLGNARAYLSAPGSHFEWYTPPEFIALAKAVLGRIDLDPASSDAAQEIVRARRYFTVQVDGTKRQWKGTVWLNPPFGRGGIRQFTDKMLEEWASGRVTAAIMLTHAHTDSDWFTRLAREASAICFPTKRVNFVSGKHGAFKGGQPAYGQALLYFGSEVALFGKTFEEVGVVVVRYARSKGGKRR